MESRSCQGIRKPLILQLFQLAPSNRVSCIGKQAPPVNRLHWCKPSMFRVFRRCMSLGIHSITKAVVLVHSGNNHHAYTEGGTSCDWITICARVCQKRQTWAKERNGKESLMIQLFPVCTNYVQATNNTLSPSVAVASKSLVFC